MVQRSVSDHTGAQATWLQQSTGTTEGYGSAKDTDSDQSSYFPAPLIKDLSEILGVKKDAIQLVKNIAAGKQGYLIKQYVKLRGGWSATQEKTRIRNS